MKKFIPFLLAFLFLASCQPSFTIQPMPENLVPSNTSLPLANLPDPGPTSTPVIDPHGISWSTLQNAQYHSSLWGDFQLTGGIYYRTPAEPNASPELYSTQLLDLHAYGDLNGDGAEDAVVLLKTQNGGNMSTKELAVALNQNGQPYIVPSVDLAPDLIAPEILQVQAGVIFLQGRTYGTDDALCCPSQVTVLQFQLQNGQLIRVADPGPTATPVIDSHGISWSTLQNAQYHSPLSGDFQLTGGIYYRTPAEPNASPELYSTQLLDLHAYGDLNGDGAEDAVVLLKTQNGGNMSTKELAVALNQNGQPYITSSVDLGLIVPEILQVQAGVIFLQGRTYGTDDALCCPSQVTVLQFQLQNRQLIRVADPGPTPPPTNTPPSSTIAPSTRNNLYGIPNDSPTWLVKPLDSEHPFNILVLGVDQKCTLTINTKTNLQNLTVYMDSLTLGRHSWQVTRTFQGTQQVDEIYVPDSYPPEYIEAAGSSGYGYAMNGFYDSCRLAIQGILAEMQ